MEDFGAYSGLRMNPDKTSLFRDGSANQDVTLTHDFGFKQGEFPVKYLGLPLMSRKLKLSEYNPLIDSVKQRLQMWTVRCLSFAGRLQLLTSVIYSKLTFWFSAFLLPSGCVKKITSMCNNFLWGGNPLERASIKVSWMDACLPKSEGGLGLRDITKWNTTLRLKLIWRLFTSKDSLWVAWCRENLIRKNNFWILKERQGDSWTWKCILRLRPLAIRFLHCHIVSGKSVLFWWDKWLQVGRLRDLIIGRSHQTLGIPINATVQEAEWIWSKDISRIRRHDIKQICIAIQSTPRPRTCEIDDKWGWHLDYERMNEFSTNYTWKSLRPSAPKVHWKKAIWFTGNIPKWSFHMWTAMLDRLPVRERIARWNTATSPMCVVCSTYVESRDHVLLHCDFAENIWAMILQRLGQHPSLFHNWSSLITWISSKSLHTPSLLKKLAVHATIYMLWFERNNRLHNASSNTEQAIFRRIDRMVRDAILARRNCYKFHGLLQYWFRYQ